MFLVQEVAEAGQLLFHPQLLQPEPVQLLAVVKELLLQ